MVPGLYPTAHGCKRRLPAWDSAASRGHGRGLRPLGVRGGRVPAVLTGGAPDRRRDLAIGLLTPLAAMATAGVMIVATQTRLRAGIWSQRGGFDSPRCWPPSAAAHVMSAHSSMPTASPRPLWWSVRSPPLLRGTGADTAARPLSAWPTARWARRRRRWLAGGLHTSVADRRSRGRILSTSGSSAAGRRPARG